MHSIQDVYNYLFHIYIVCIKALYTECGKDSGCLRHIMLPHFLATCRTKSVVLQINVICKDLCFSYINPVSLGNTHRVRQAFI